MNLPKVELRGAFEPFDFKPGEVACGEPNITQSCVFTLDGEPVGFYLRELPKRCVSALAAADTELNSDRVPKSEMSRGRIVDGKMQRVVQYSSILGGVPPKPHMRRPYFTKSSVHSVKSASRFIYAMEQLRGEGERLVELLLPGVYGRRRAEIMGIPEKWRFGELFTSSISNANISAPYHRDNANIKGSVNLIFWRRVGAIGGDLCLPEYGAVIESCDLSLCCYPAWMSWHGVTPIVKKIEGGYRNSHVFYPLSGFGGAP